jgi:phosphonate transport system permease protein
MSELTSIRARYPEQFRRLNPSRALSVLVIFAMLALLAYGWVSLEFSLARLVNGFGRLGEIFVLMLPPDPGWGTRLPSYLKAISETLAIAFLGTLLAAVLALPLSLLAARNTTVHSLVKFLTRRSFDTIRGVDMLIWALLWINVVGMGPFAGVLAIICADVAALGKLFSETIEAADRKPVDGVLSTGSGPLQQVRFAIIPQVLPVFLSQVLYYFESNTRSATIIGIVGAGGIGMILSEQIRTLEFREMSFVILMVLVVVSVIDLLCNRLRFSVIGPGARA